MASYNSFKSDAINTIFFNDADYIHVTSNNHREKQKTYFFSLKCSFFLIFETMRRLYMFYCANSSG